MIGIVIPTHNEEALLDVCLAAARRAIAHPALGGEMGRVVVVLDSCTDRSADIARDHGVDVIEISARNVGIARAAGADALLAIGARWLAFTDADSRVAPDWLREQLALNAEAVCGLVTVDDWTPHSADIQAAFYRAYVDSNGHRHIHGANFGVSARAYRCVGGFPPLECSEDVALVELLIAAGVRIAWSAMPRVMTSSRVDSRVRGGFGDTLAALGED